MRAYYAFVNVFAVACANVVRSSNVAARAALVALLPMIANAQAQTQTVLPPVCGQALFATDMQGVANFIWAGCPQRLN